MQSLASKAFFYLLDGELVSVEPLQMVDEIEAGININDILHIW